MGPPYCRPHSAESLTCRNDAISFCWVHRQNVAKKMLQALNEPPGPPSKSRLARRPRPLMSRSTSSRLALGPAQAHHKHHDNAVSDRTSEPVQPPATCIMGNRNPCRAVRPEGHSAALSKEQHPAKPDSYQARRVQPRRDNGPGDAVFVQCRLQQRHLPKRTSSKLQSEF